MYSLAKIDSLASNTKVLLLSRSRHILSCLKALDVYQKVSYENSSTEFIMSSRFGRNSCKDRCFVSVFLALRTFSRKSDANWMDILSCRKISWWTDYMSCTFIISYIQVLVAIFTHESFFIENPINRKKEQHRLKLNWYRQYRKHKVTMVGASVLLAANKFPINILIIFTSSKASINEHNICETSVLRM